MAGSRYARSMEDAELMVLRADLIDMDGEYVVCAELPGVKREDIEVRVMEEGIQICGECECDRGYKAAGGKYLKKELVHTKACRYVAFPEKAAPEGARIELANGLLEVRVPKVRSMMAGKVAGERISPEVYA